MFQTVGEEVSSPPPSLDAREEQLTLCKVLKYLVSTLLVFFSIAVTIALVLDEETKVAQDVSPGIAIAIICIATTWLFMIEGGQASMVGLPPVERELYKDSHPITYKICSVAHKGNNLDRYLIGRQFMVLLMVFTTNQCGSAFAGAGVFNLPDWFQDVLLGSGIALILITACLGQLMSQVNASHCMLDFADTHFMTVTLYTCLAIEACGLLHCVYLVQYIFTMISGKPIQSNEEPRTWIQGFFFWIRVVMSLGILSGCLAVTISALFKGQTTSWDAIPNGIAVILFFLCMYIVGMLEGMQIAFFSVSKLTVEERASSPMAALTCDVLYRGNNLPNFMIGRQICVTLNFFVIARLTTLDINVDDGAGDETIFGVSKTLQGFFNTGLPGAIVTTILGSIVWQLVASAYPKVFLGSPFVHILLRVCLLLENSGVCSAAWFFGLMHKKVAGYQYDETYIGTNEERKARKKAELIRQARLRPGQQEAQKSKLSNDVDMA